MHLTRDEINQLQAGQYLLDVFDFTLQRRGDPAATYRGPGFVRQTAGGEIEYTVYDKGRELGPPFELSLPVGKSLDDEMYFDVEARDWRGRTWHGENGLPPARSGVSGAKGVVCHGQLREISCIGDTSQDDQLWLFFPGEFTIPANAGTHTTEVSPLGEFQRFNPNAWAIKTNEYDIYIINGSGGMEALVIPNDGPLPAMFDTRLEEALWFTLAVPARWSLLEEHRGGAYRFRIRTPRDLGAAPRLKPPLRPEPGHLAEYSADILNRYLTYILPYGKPRYHPISVKVLQLLRGSALSLNAEALGLAIAIESLARREFSSLGCPEKELIGHFDSAIQYIKGWPGDDSVKERIVRFISGWKGTNPRESLKKLVEKGVITEEQREAWNTLRHPIVHGQEIDKLLDRLSVLCDMAYVGWLRMVFEAIGYSGPYTDRSVEGWPTSEYSSGRQRTVSPSSNQNSQNPRED